MAGLARICKIYGSMEVSGPDGKKVTWLWDYANDKPRLKTEMNKEEIAASERAKWDQLAGLAKESSYEWVCNECNFPNFTGSIPESEIESELHSCINCGCFEFHKRPIKK